MPLYLQQRPCVPEGATDTVSIDFGEWLDSGELLTGTPTVVELSTSDLTLTNKAVNTAALTILGNTVAIGEAVQFSVSGQLASVGTYIIQITATTDATPARIWPVRIYLDVI